MADNQPGTRTAYLWINHPVDATKRSVLTITQTQQTATTLATNATNATTSPTAGTQATIGQTFANFATPATNATTLATNATLSQTFGGGSGGGCIMQDELVLMDNGTSKKIQDVIVGDVVKSLSITGLSNEEDAWKTWSTVEGDFVSSNINTTITEIATETFPEYYTLAFDINEEAKNLKVTGEHPVLVKREDLSVAFIQVADIVAGDSIRYFPNNSWSVLTSVVKTTGNTIPTYNLGAENSDNYFANGIVVHNAANVDKR
jgi:hypothetical protein|tara:strand:+ start:1317 stop:2099 length:783 start_codon:yes stop_codon:yes gene_type:complete